MEAVREQLIERGYISRNVVIYGPTAVTRHIKFNDANGWKTIYVSTEDGLFDALRSLYKPCIIAFDDVTYRGVPIIYPDGFYILNLKARPTSMVITKLLTTNRNAMKAILEFSPLEKEHVEEAMSIVSAGEGMSDWDTIGKLREWVTKNGYAQSSIYKLVRRANSRANDVIRFIRSHPKSILDIGCSDGLILSALCKRLKPTYALGVDVRESKRWNELSSRSLEYKSIAPDILIDDHSMVTNKTFDLITCFMTLHHIERWDEVIATCFDLLNPGGRLLIREQCFEETTPVDSYISYVQHALYAMVWGRTVEDPLYPYDNDTYHMTPNDLMKTAGKLGFRQIRVHVERYHAYLLFAKPFERPIEDTITSIDRRRHADDMLYASKRSE